MCGLGPTFEDQHSLEFVQTFTLRTATPSWRANAEELNSQFQLPILNSRRSYFKLLMIFMGSCTAPPGLFVFCASSNTRVSHFSQLVVPTRLAGASLREPHTSELNGGFFIYIYISPVRMSFRKSKLTLFNPKHAHTDLCRRNIEKNTWSKNKDGTLPYLSLEESYFWALNQSFTFSVLGYWLFLNMDGIILQSQIATM